MLQRSMGSLEHISVLNHTSDHELPHFRTGLPIIRHTDQKTGGTGSEAAQELG